MNRQPENATESDTFEPVRDCWYLTGATASGKTRVGIELAKLLNAEIISLDSMSVYCDMNIGTAKPTKDQRAEVPHHLIDVVSPNQEYSLSQFVRDAHQAMGEIRQRGREVLFVGGTPLYLKALLRGVYPGPPADWDFRNQIEAELETAGIEALHARLEQVDPLAAAKLHPNDKRRIIRALEVHRHTGQPLSHEQTHFDEIPHDQCKAFVLAWPRVAIHRRIEQRVERMFQTGLIEEVGSLLEKYGELGRTASQAVGYREVIAHLQQDEGLADVIDRVKARTRQFARRQETWFRNLEECEFVPIKEEPDPHGFAKQLIELAK